jgi:tryptophanyl-tRNA synthetase
MASDILLYQTDLVPVGGDQKQHVEICRDIAQRFNGIYGDVFTIPEPYIPKATAKIMSLQEPTRKMSKSDPEETFIAVLDKPEDIRRKLKRAVTDSDGEIRYDPEAKPGVSNLLTILSVLKKQSMEETVASLSGLGYGTLKEAVSEAVIAEHSPIQERYNAIIADKDGMAAMLKRNAERAAYLAQKTLRKVYKKVGLYQV